MSPFPPSRNAPVLGPPLLATLYGGDEGVRTLDPLLAGQVLSQLSYTPVGVFLLNDRFSVTQN